jgi:uncharacterized protein YndB with AHSA1/START domain
VGDRAYAEDPRERGGVATPFRFDRVWEFPVPVDRFWTVLERTDRYPDWWSWLREFEADGFTAGTEARVVIQSPLPYALRCTIRIDEMRPREAIVTTVSGDLRGPARLEIAPSNGGSSARLVWALSPGTFVLRQLAVVGRPAMVWAHDRVVAVGVEQFRRRAIVPERDLLA